MSEIVGKEGDFSELRNNKKVWADGYKCALELIVTQVLFADLGGLGPVFYRIMYEGMGTKYGT